MKTLDELMAEDVKSTFLNEGFSKEAIYVSSLDSTTITIQLFEENLESLEASFFHAWCASEDIPNFTRNVDRLIVDDIAYGIMDASPDEFQHGINLFLQKV